MRRFVSLLCALALVGCGGRSLTMPPLSSDQPGRGAASAGRSAGAGGAVPAGTLYVAGLDRIAAYPLSADGSPSPDRVFTNSSFYAPDGPNVTGAHIAGISTEGLGVLDVIVGLTFSGLPNGCELVSYNSDANGTAPPQPRHCETIGPIGISGRPSGAVDYLGSRFQAGRDAVYRLRADGSTLLRVEFAPPVDAYHGLAEDADANVYVTVTGPSRVDVYPTSGAGVSGTRSRTFSVTGTPGAIAVSPADGTIYVASSVAGSSPMDYVYAFANGASSPSRTIGPFPNHVTALTVDGAGELYVGLTDAGIKSSKVRVYACDADGQATPLRSVLNPLHGNGTVPATIVGLAIGIPSPPQPELYVGNKNLVEVFPLGANDMDAPKRTLTGFLYGDGSATSPLHQAVGLAAGQNGTLDVLESITTGSTVTDDVLVFPSGSNGAQPPHQTWDAGGGTPIGIVTERSGAIDVLAQPLDRPAPVVNFIYGPGGPGGHLDTPTPQGPPSNCCIGPASSIGGADDSGIVLGTSYYGYFFTYAPRSYNATAPLSRTVVNKFGGPPLAVSPNGTVYVLGWDGIGDQNSIEIFLPHAMSPTGAIGPFARSSGRTSAPYNGNIMALAVDGAGLVYVAFTLFDAGGAVQANTIEVYEPNGSGPLRTLHNPIPPSMGAIKSLAVSR